MAKKSKTCAQPGCNRKIEPWMTHCYKHHHQKKGDYKAKKLQKIHGGTK
ncbi:MAG: hypothetical protein ACFE8A_13455 [Candidatus Hodarchaeota archaeon]